MLYSWRVWGSSLLLHPLQLTEGGPRTEANGLKELADVLAGYGEQYFEGTPGQKDSSSKHGAWARVLLICGQFERVGHLPALRPNPPDLWLWRFRLWLRSTRSPNHRARLSI